VKLKKKVNAVFLGCSANFKGDYGNFLPEIFQKKLNFSDRELSLIACQLMEYCNNQFIGVPL
jgi:hypothetical protein